MKRIVVAALVLLGSSALAEASSADCLFIANGNKVIDGPCEFDPLPLSQDIRKGSFQITAGDYFAVVNVEPNGKALGFYNEFSGSRQPSGQLGQIVAAGACWQNENSKICAWKPGERENTVKASPVALIDTPTDTYCRSMASQAFSFGRQIYKECMIRMAQKLSNQ